jgi:hypothetical protein
MVCDLRCQRRIAFLRDEVQRQVDAGRDAGARGDRIIEHEDAVGDHLAALCQLAQLVQVLVMGGDAPAPQQAGVRGQQRARADRDQPQAAVHRREFA